MKLYVNQCENKTMMNVEVSVKNQMMEVLVKMIMCGIVARVIVNAIEHVKLINIQVLKIVHWKEICLVNKYQNVRTKCQIQLKPYLMNEK